MHAYISSLVSQNVGHTYLFEQTSVSFQSLLSGVNASLREDNVPSTVSADVTLLYRMGIAENCLAKYVWAFHMSNQSLSEYLGG